MIILLTYLGGITTGILLSILVLIIALWSKPKIERKINQLSSQLKEKGKVLEPESEILSTYLDSLPKEHEEYNQAN